MLLRNGGSLKEHQRDGVAGSYQSDLDRGRGFCKRDEMLVVGYLVRRVRDPETAADLTAKVFATAFESASRYRPVTTSVRAAFI
jgi:hypothetical protein